VNLDLKAGLYVRFSAFELSVSVFDKTSNFLANIRDNEEIKALEGLPEKNTFDERFPPKIRFRILPEIENGSVAADAFVPEGYNVL